MTDNKVSLNILLETDEDNITVYAKIISGSKSPENAEELLNIAISNHGCTGLNVSDSTIKEINTLIANNQSAKVKLGNKIDAKVEAIVSADLLSATLRITAAQGGKRVDSHDIIHVLDDKEIQHHFINKKRIVGLVRKSRIIEPGTEVEVIVAKGRPPIDGTDTQFECLLKDVTDRKPSKRTDGTLDYYDLGEIVCVDENCELMRKHPAKPEKPGIAVTGIEIPARKSKSLNFQKCKGSIVSPNDPGLLIAEIKGQPIIAERGVNVDNVLTVKKVDLRTGHIDYDGSLVVKGDVASGMSINVSGDVQIFGMVENAAITAKGNVDIKLGAIGHTDSPTTEDKMQINCLGNLTAGYIENIQADVQGDVLIKSIASNCHLLVGQQLIVGNPRQEKSGIVGGDVLSGLLIRAESLGSSGCAITQVAINYNAEVIEKYCALKHEIEQQEKLLVSKLGKMVALSKKHTEEAKIQLNELKKETEDRKSSVNTLISQKIEIESTMKQADQGKIIVHKEVFPGVTIKILDQQQSIKSRYGEGTFLLVNGAIAHNASTQ